MTYITFRTRKAFVDVCNTLNDTMYNFAVADKNTIILYSNSAVKLVKNACDSANIKYTITERV